MSGSRLPGVVSGPDERLHAAARMECGVCWHVYDPAEGCDHWQIPPGTAFLDLPDHWRCPQCDNDKSVFLPLGDTAPASAPAEADPMAARVAALLAHFRSAAERMRDLPVYNHDLAVEAVGFLPWQDCWLGILITPWFMNIVLLPQEAGAWDHLTPGAVKQSRSLPSGDYEFELGRAEGPGSYLACSLFSPMGLFDSQTVAREVAEAAMAEMMKAPEAAAPPQPEPPKAEQPKAVNRRDLFRGLLGE